MTQQNTNRSRDPRLLTKSAISLAAVTAGWILDGSLLLAQAPANGPVPYISAAASGPGSAPPAVPNASYAPPLPTATYQAISPGAAPMPNAAPVASSPYAPPASGPYVPPQSYQSVAPVAPGPSPYPPAQYQQPASPSYPQQPTWPVANSAAVPYPPQQPQPAAYPAQAYQPAPQPQVAPVYSAQAGAWQYPAAPSLAVPPQQPMLPPQTIYAPQQQMPAGLPPQYPLANPPAFAAPPTQAPLPQTVVGTPIKLPTDSPIGTSVSQSSAHVAGTTGGEPAKKESAWRRFSNWVTGDGEAAAVPTSTPTEGSPFSASKIVSPFAKPNSEYIADRQSWGRFRKKPNNETTK